MALDRRETGECPARPRIRTPGRRAEPAQGDNARSQLAHLPLPALEQAEESKGTTVSFRGKSALLAAGTAASLLAVSACGSSGSKPAADSGKKTGVTLKVLIGSSGDAETNALTAAGKAWGAATGNT